MKYAKKTFLESLVNYEAINHYYAMSYCYDMLQEIKRFLKEDFSTEYRNYILLQQKINGQRESNSSKFVERSQGAEMSLFIENVFIVESSSVPSHFKGSDVDDLVKHVLDKKKLIETVEKENQNETQNFMQNVIGFISDDHNDGGYILPTLSTNDFSKRRSIDANDNAALHKIFNSAPKTLKVKEKFKEKLRNSMHMEQKISDDAYFRSVSNKIGGNISLKNIMRTKFKSKKTKTLNSEDLSDNSSDLEFAKNNRVYNITKQERLSSTIDSNFLQK